MGLRLIIIGLVASLGLDLPAAEDLRSWARSGQTWLCTALDEWDDCTAGEEASSKVGVGSPKPVVAAETGEVSGTIATRSSAAEGSAEMVADREFAEVVEEMIVTFAAEEPMKPLLEAGDALVQEVPVGGLDGSLPRTEITVIEDSETSSTIAFDPIEVPADLYPGIAYALNREADGLAGDDQVPPAIAAVECAPATTVEPPVEMIRVSRGQRLANAVRLTGEAFQAWANLIRGPAVASIRP
jgi:hypothetical protein